MANSREIRIQIIGGFLGSGKTTLINSLLTKIPTGRKVALIVNEFGEISVDGALVERGSYSVMEIMGGCVCCTLKTQLVEGLVQIIRKEKPEEIYIEATGMAVPEEMKENIETGLPDPGSIIPVRVTVCVDAMQYRKAAGNLPIYDRQFEGSPAIYFTKKDIYSRTLIDEVKEDIGRRYGGGTGAFGIRYETEEPSSEIIQITFSGDTGPTIEELSAVILEMGEDIIRAKGIESKEVGKAGEVVQYDGNRIDVMPALSPISPPYSCIVFCLACSREKIASRFSHLYS